MICVGACAAPNLGDVLRALASAGVRFAIVGGVALQLHGSSYTTFDLDLAYDRTRENAVRLAAALLPFAPRPRGIPDDLPFVFDAQTLMTNEVLTLITTAGEIDLLAVIKGIGSFAEVERLAEPVAYDGYELLVLGIEGLIVSKRAAGRPKDHAGLIELEALREARRIAEGLDES